MGHEEKYWHFIMCAKVVFHIYVEYILYEFTLNGSQWTWNLFDSFQEKWMFSFYNEILYELS